MPQDTLTVQQELIPLNSRSAWEDALLNLKHDFSHTWENCYAMHLTTRLKTFLYVLKVGETKVVSPIAEREYEGNLDIVTPYGFSGFISNLDFNDFQSHWIDFARDKGYVCGYISLNPMLGNQSLIPDDDLFMPNSLYILDLSPSLEELFANIDRNRKRQLRDWKTILPQFITEKEKLIPFFLEHYDVFFSEKNASQSYFFSTDTLRYLLNLENVLMVGIGKKDKLEAVSVFAYTPYAAQSLFHISLPEGKQHTTPLLWYAITHLKRRQVPFLNMGGGLAEGDSIAQYKQRFGTRRVPLLSLRQIFDQATYEALCLKAGVDASDRSGYFPAYCQRR